MDTNSSTTRAAGATPKGTPNTQGKVKQQLSRALPALTFLVILCTSAILLRGPDLLLNMPFNPDEAELLAQGRRAQVSLFPPYESFTTTTHTLLWPMFMGALGLIGIPLGFVTAHIIAAVAYVLLAFTMYLVTAHHLGWKIAFLLVLPSSIWILSLTGDFLSLSSELLPMLMIALAVLIFSLPRTSPTLPRLVAAAVILGCVFWAKPQLTPVAASITLTLILITVLSTRHGSPARSVGRLTIAMVGVTGFLAPTIMVLVVLLASNNLVNFYEETVLYQLSYVTERDTLGGQSPNMLIRPSLAAIFVTGFAPAVLWALAAFVVWVNRSGASDRSIINWQVAIWIIPMVAAFVTLTMAFPLFDHYANILFVSFMTSGTLVIATTSWWTSALTRNEASSVTVEVAFLVALVVISLSILPRIWDNGSIWRDGNIRFSSQDVSSEPLTAICPPNSRVVVWGWASELYAWFSWIPASRFVNSWQLAPLINIDRHKQALEAELAANPPDCIVEANGDGFFGSRLLPGSFTDTMQGSSAFLDSCYQYSREQLSDQRFVDVWRKTTQCG